jgi:glycyl-tRNA synthetase
VDIERFAKLMMEHGFFYPSFEIYRGKADVGGFYDYGPLGVELKRNIVEKWRRIFIQPYDFIVEVETPIIMPRIVFEASGHLEHFVDYVVECRSCGRRYRADHLVEEELGSRGISVKTEGLGARELGELIAKYNLRCPECGGELGEVRAFNLLFQTTIGPYSESLGYLRPETAQGMFVSFPRIFNMVGRKLPLGIAQVGKVGRNEVSPRQGMIRLREFNQMEIEFFFDPEDPRCPYLDELRVKVRILPEEDVARGSREPREYTPRSAVDSGVVPNEWMVFFMGLSTIYLNELGVPLDHQFFLAKLPSERAHYAAAVFDQVVLTERFGWVEVSGHAYRTDYDLRRHMEFSGYDLTVERRLREPREAVDVRIYPNPARIREVYGNDAPRVMEAIARADPSRIIEGLRRGELVLGGFRVTPDMVHVREERRRIYVEKFVPHVVEPSFGVDRILYVTLEKSYREVDGRPVLGLPPDVAPIKVAVLPIIKRNDYVRISREIRRILSSANIRSVYDDDGSIGSRYSRYDSMGVPLAITIDEESPTNGTVTIRDRDTRVQVRVGIGELPRVIKLILEERRSMVEIARENNLPLVGQ